MIWQIISIFICFTSDTYFHPQEVYCAVKQHWQSDVVDSKNVIDFRIHHCFANASVLTSSFSTHAESMQNGPIFFQVKKKNNDTHGLKCSAQKYIG